VANIHSEEGGLPGQIFNLLQGAGLSTQQEFLPNFVQGLHLLVRARYKLLVLA